MVGLYQFPESTLPFKLHMCVSNRLGMRFCIRYLNSVSASFILILMVIKKHQSCESLASSVFLNLGIIFSLIMLISW